MTDDTPKGLAVVKRTDQLPLEKDIEVMSLKIHGGEDILILIIRANLKLIVSAEGNPTALAHQSNEGYLALYQLKIAFAPILALR